MRSLLMGMLSWRSSALVRCEFSAVRLFSVLVNVVSSRTRPFNGLAIGWIPVKTEQDWRDSIKESFEDILYNDILRGV